MIYSSYSWKDDEDHQSRRSASTPLPQRAVRRGTRENSLSVLRRCFSKEEWAWLEQEPAFQAALEELEGLDDAENVIKTGLRLIYLARKGAVPSGRPPPRVLHVWH